MFGGRVKGICPIQDAGFIPCPVWSHGPKWRAAGSSDQAMPAPVAEPVTIRFAGSVFRMSGPGALGDVDFDMIGPANALGCPSLLW